MSDIEQTERIPLTQGKYALVDAADYEWLNQWKWGANLSHKNWYASRRKCTNGNDRAIHMHREILAVPAGLFTDHINGNGLDNRRKNLRICTHSQNQHNSRWKGSASGYKGVSRSQNKWLATIKVNGRQLYLGRFDTPELAAAAYDIGAVKYHKEFAKTNKMLGLLK